MVFEKLKCSFGALFKFFLMGAIAYDEKLAAPFLGGACQMVGMVGEGGLARAGQEDRYSGNEAQELLHPARQAQLECYGHLGSAAWASAFAGIPDAYHRISAPMDPALFGGE